MQRLVPVVAAILVLLLPAGIALAQNPSPDAVVLTIDGEIRGGAGRDFSITQLEALGLTTVETSTPWHDGRVRFEGVPLQRLMEYVGASGKTASVLALNNYRTEIPLSDFADHSTILATRRDGHPMPVTDKGPLFIIYPYDSSRDLKTELYYARSAWQVRRITIE